MWKSKSDSKYFGESLGYLCFPCQNRQKPPKNMQIIYCVVSLRNWLCPDFSGFDRIWDQNLPDYHFHFFRPSLNGFSRYFFEIHQNLHANRLGVTARLFKRQKHKILQQTCSVSKNLNQFQICHFELSWGPQLRNQNQSATK